jgi:hypothetical protein
MSQLHQRPRSEASLSDEYETKQEVFDAICRGLGLVPNLDVCATEKNRKVHHYFSKEVDSLKQNWSLVLPKTQVIAWVNPPQTICKEFVVKCREQYKAGVIIVMMIPANSLGTKYAVKNIWIPKLMLGEHIGVIPLAYFYDKTLRFLVDGKDSKDTARNRYFVVVMNY